MYIPAVMLHCHKVTAEYVEERKEKDKMTVNCEIKVSTYSYNLGIYLSLECRKFLLTVTAFICSVI